MARSFDVPYGPAKDMINTWQELSDMIHGLKPPLEGIKLSGDTSYRNFKKNQNNFISYFSRLGKLKPTDKILDVGCGFGRMAAPLTKYLSAGGSYYGFDIYPKAIDWCNKHIANKYRNFNFHAADIHNRAYNPTAAHRASEYKFPYQDNSFDFIFLTSVFTHMMPPDLENYLSEISRVLKKSSRCLITFFLLNETSRKLIFKRRSTLDFKQTQFQYYTIDNINPELALAYEENFIRNSYKKYNLKISEPLYYGSWCGRSGYLDYQDMIVAVKD